MSCRLLFNAFAGECRCSSGQSCMAAFWFFCSSWRPPSLRRKSWPHCGTEPNGAMRRPSAPWASDTGMAAVWRQGCGSGIRVVSEGRSPGLRRWPEQIGRHVLRGAGPGTRGSSFSGRARPRNRAMPLPRAIWAGLTKRVGGWAGMPVGRRMVRQGLSGAARDGGGRASGSPVQSGQYVSHGLGPAQR